MRAVILFLVALGFVSGTGAEPGETQGAKPCTSLKGGGSISWPPVAYVEETTGEFSGLAYDVLREVAKQLDRPLTLESRLPWKRVLAHLDDGRLDVVTGVFLTDEWANRFEFSDPIVNVGHVLFVRKDKQFTFERLDDLAGRTGGIVLGEAVGGGFDEFRIKHLKVEVVREPRLLFKMLMRGRIDYIPMNYFTGLEFIKMLELSEQVVVLPKPVSSSPLCIAFSKRSSCRKLIPEVNKLLLEMREDGRIDRMIDRCLSEESDVETDVTDE